MAGKAGTPAGWVQKAAESQWTINCPDLKGNVVKFVNFTVPFVTIVSIRNVSNRYDAKRSKYVHITTGWWSNGK